MRKIILSLLLLVGLVVLKTNAFALDPGTPFYFYDNIAPTGLNYTHILNEATDFFSDSLYTTNIYPAVSDPLDITSALLSLQIVYTPDQSGNSGEFQIKVKTELDEFNIGIIKEKLDTGGQQTTS